MIEDKYTYPFIQNKDGEYTEGYWRKNKDEQSLLPFPNPTNIKVNENFISKVNEIQFLSKSHSHSILSNNSYMEYSHCRLCDLKQNGNSETIIKYKNQANIIFPEGLLHYYCVHNVQPSKEFITVINDTYELLKNEIKIDNSRLILVFSYLRILREMDGKDDSAKALKTSTDIIEQCKFQIVNGQQISHIPGIGKKSIEYINNILLNNNPNLSGIYELDNLDQQKLHKLKTILEMTKIPGVGVISAKHYYESGITDIQKFKELLASGGGTTRQKIGNKYVEEFKKRIPREKIKLFIEKFDDVIKQYNNHYGTSIKYDICGSYSRGKDTSGDIDIILWSLIPKQVSLNFPILHDGLTRGGLIKETLSSGGDSWQGVAYIDDEFHAVRLDFKLLENINEYYYAKLYFTGPAELNREMRDKANTMGMTLGNNDLTIKNTGDKIYVRTEQDIFELLGIKWKSPTDR